MLRSYPSSPSVASIDEELTRLADLDLFAGVVLIGQRDEVLLHKAYGLADRENGVPFAQNTVSSIGSITKQLTAAAILRLQEEGRLRVTDTLGMHFPGVPPDKAALSVHQLLTHSSGLPDALGEDEDWIGREDYLAAAWSAELQFGPGTAYAYSNVGYSVLAAVVETLSNKGYEQFLHESFFGPLGIRETGYRRPGWDLSRVARSWPAT